MVITEITSDFIGYTLLRLYLYIRQLYATYTLIIRLRLTCACLPTTFLFPTLCTHATYQTSANAAKLNKTRKRYYRRLQHRKKDRGISFIGARPNPLGTAATTDEDCEAMVE
jgi:hypothetical protein